MRGDVGGVELEMRSQEQIRASLASGAGSMSHHSRSGLSCSAILASPIQRYNLSPGRRARHGGRRHTGARTLAARRA